MGRIFEKRKDRMFARWAKNARAFTKLGREIALAVKLGGGDASSNPRLRAAVQTARSLNMPKDTIENAIKRASAKDEAGLQEITYEGYGPHGVAIFIEAAADNPTRTVANIRSIFTRWGGSLGTNGSLAYLFQRKGVISIGQPKGDMEEFELDLIDAGLEDLFETDDGFLIYSAFSDFGAIQRALEEKKVEIKSASLQRIPNTTTQLTSEQEAEVNSLIEALEEDEDVQQVFHNMAASSSGK